MFNEEQQKDNDSFFPPSKRLKCSFDSTTATTTDSSHYDDEKFSAIRSSLPSQQQRKPQQFACLRNLGSTCYINCIIQVMRYSPGFALSIHRLSKQIDYLKSLNASLENDINNNNDSMFVKHLHELLIEMSDKEKLDRRPIYSPRKFVNTVWSSLNFWSDGSQQDAHEFLQYTIHFINECDLYLKKLHQQYQLKQMEAIDLKVKLGEQVLASDDESVRCSRQNREKPQTLFKCKSDIALETVATRTMQKSTSTLIESTSTTTASYLRTPTKGGASTAATTTSSLEPESKNNETGTITTISSTNLLKLSFLSKITTTPIGQQKMLEINRLKTNRIEQIIETHKQKQAAQFAATAAGSASIKREPSVIDLTIDDEPHLIQNLSPILQKLSPKVGYFAYKNSLMRSVSTKTEETNQEKKAVPCKKEEIILKDCYVLLERLDMSKFNKQQESKQKPVADHKKQTLVKTAKRLSVSEGVKRLRYKAKTFPEPNVTQLNEPFDAIVSLSSSCFQNNSNPSAGISTTSSGKQSRSAKLRTTSFNENYTRILSPAELLRKYSSIKGHICEMDKIFKGSSVTLTQCLACENLRKCPEAFYDRSLPVNTITNESMDLEWVMKCLSNESYLDEDSKYMCDVCVSKQEAKIYTQYTEMPKILVLHLLSYGITSSIDGNLNTQKLNSRSKLVTCFDCVCTDCSNNNGKNHVHNTNRHVFKLYAVVMHSGVSLNSGHYTAFINYQTMNENIPNTTDNKDDLLNNLNNNNCACTNSHPTAMNAPPDWLHFDDTKVKLLSNTEFHQKIVDSNIDSPYILFYVKDTIYDLAK